MKKQGPIDRYVEEILQAFYPHGGCPEIIRELAYAEFEAGIMYEADECHCRKLEKELEEYKTKEKEWMKTYSEMKDRLLGYEVNAVIHEIRKQTKVK